MQTRKIRARASRLFIAASLLLSACATQPPREPQQARRQISGMEAALIGQQYIADHFPGFRKEGAEIMVLHTEEGLQMYYMVPRDFSGDVPHVLIDQSTGKVLKSWTEPIGKAKGPL